MASEPARETVKFKRRTSKKRLNKRTIDALTPPGRTPKGKPAQEWHYDSTTARLALCVWSTGAKSWYWVGRLKDGGPIRYKLGEYPEVTPEQAKTLAAEISREVVRGIDPRDERRERREEWTLGELFAEYLERYAKKHKRTWEEDDRQWQRYCGRIKGKKLSAVTRREIINLHSQVGKDNGKYAANRLVALLSKVFRYGIDDLEICKNNPAAKIKKFEEEERERFLSADELRRFFDAIEVERTIFFHFFLVLLLTGARRSNVLAMRFSEIDWEQNVWRIPTTKNKDSLRVPLVDLVVEVLKARRELVDGDWVFPARRGIEPHLTEPKTAWARVLKRANLEDVRLHDLRRTLGSWMAAGGASIPIIGKTLGHKSQQVTQVYARLDLDPVRASVETATAAMLAAKGGAK